MPKTIIVLLIITVFGGRRNSDEIYSDDLRVVIHPSLMVARTNYVTLKYKWLVQLLIFFFFNHFKTEIG